MPVNDLNRDALGAEFFAVLPDALCVIDADGRIAEANGALAAILGTCPDRLRGQPWRTFLRPCADSGAGPAALPQDGGALRPAAEDTGELCWHPLHRDAAGRTYGRLAPMSARRDGAEVEAVRARGEALEQALQKAQAASQAKSRFLANLSHEIRTPLNAVFGVLEMLQTRLPDPETRGLLEVIRENSDSLLTILNDVLDFSKIEAGRVQFERIPFEPGDLARRMESLHGLKAREKGLDFRVHLAPEAEAARVGDPHRLLQVAHNLVSNAIKFTERGRIEVVFDSPSGEDLRLTVRDTGVGMTEDQSARAFEAFTQADASTTRRYGGTGLGLSIVRGLVTGMGGTIAFDSSPGSGTEVVVCLPFARSPDGMATRDGRKHAVALPRGLRVLAVDDNATNRMVLRAQLERFGASVTEAADGHAAVAEAARRTFDLYLLDISMPDLDGPEVLRLIREDEARQAVPPTPAVAVTAHALPQQVQEFLEAGFVSHVPKPVKARELYAILARVVALQKFGAADQARPAGGPGYGTAA